MLALSAMLSSLPLLAIETWAGRLMLPSPVGWAVLGYVVVFPSFISQLSFLRAVDLVGPGRAGLFVNLVPIFAAALGVVLLGESFELYHGLRSEEHTSELQSLMRISYAVFCLKKKNRSDSI